MEHIIEGAVLSPEEYFEHKQYVADVHSTLAELEASADKGKRISPKKAAVFREVYRQEYEVDKKTNKQIAEEFEVAPGRISQIVKEVYEKLQVHMP